MHLQISVYGKLVFGVAVKGKLRSALALKLDEPVKRAFFICNAKTRFGRSAAVKGKFRL